MKTLEQLPKFDELVDKRRYWEWGEPGSYTEGLGKLNLLTDANVAKAAGQEIRTGERVGLGWELHNMQHPPFLRPAMQMKLNWTGEGAGKPMSFDDEYVINPQSGSQWDGFRHHAQFLHADKATDFGDNSGDADDMTVFHGGTKPSEILDRTNDRIGIHHWAKKGIVGRGVLLDYAEYAKEKGIEYSCFTQHNIKLADLKAIVAEKNIQLLPGDILFVRIGLPNEWANKSADDQREHEQTVILPHHAGVEQSEDVLRWIWDNHFVAVAGDALAWEVFPPQDHHHACHQYLLAGWGVPIGEMFNLEGLSELCKKHNRWSFFVTSAPWPAVGGVSSPPNAIAIF